MQRNPLSLRETHKYDDIINMSYPLECSDRIKHPRMRVEDRAKIFAPFAALKGYEEAIAARERVVVPKIELSDESKEYLDGQLKRIEQLLAAGQHPMVTVVYFQRNKAVSEDYGEYIKLTGMVAGLEETSRILQIIEKRLHFENIYKIEIEDTERS